MHTYKLDALCTVCLDTRHITIIVSLLVMAYSTARLVWSCVHHACDYINCRCVFFSHIIHHGHLACNSHGKFRNFASINCWKQTLHLQPQANQWTPLYMNGPLQACYVMAVVGLMKCMHLMMVVVLVLMAVWQEDIGECSADDVMPWLSEWSL